MNGFAKIVDLGGRAIGPGHPVALAVEIGTFFNRDIGIGLDYVDRSIDSGAELLKSEILHDADICLANTGLKHEYRHAGGQTVEDYRALIERKTVPLAEYEKLIRRCTDGGVPFIASVYDFTGIDFLRDQGGAGIKIARNNIDHIPLIRHAAKSGLPLIFDAGEVTLPELDRALDTAGDAGAAQIIVNHHPGSNPAPAENHNLSMIPFYRERYGIPVGLSCHYRGEEIMYAAIGQGAALLEKGFDDDPDRDEQDIVSAAPLAELTVIIGRIKACSAAIGRAPVDSPENRDLSVRAGLVARERIAAGEAITLKNTGFAFPPAGIPAAAFDKAEGLAATHDIAPGQVIDWNDLDAEG